MTSLRTRLLIAVGVPRRRRRSRPWRWPSARAHGASSCASQETERHSAAAGHAATLEVVARELDGTCCSSESLARAAGRLRRGRRALRARRVRPAARAPRRGPRSAARGDVAARYKDKVLLLELSHPTARRRQPRHRCSSRRTARPSALADGSHGIVFVLSLPLHDVPAAEAVFSSRSISGCSGRRFSSACWHWRARGSSLAVPCARSPTCGQRRWTWRAAGCRAASGPTAPRKSSRSRRRSTTMAAELERQQTLRQSLVRDVAHELRTPLTALQCRLETAIDGLSPDPVGSLSDLHDQVRHLSKLVDDLQDLALAEARELRAAARVRARGRPGGVRDPRHRPRTAISACAWSSRTICTCAQTSSARARC